MRDLHNFRAACVRWSILVVDDRERANEPQADRESNLDPGAQRQ